MESNKPSVGRVVHYVQFVGEKCTHLAATIASVYQNGEVTLVNLGVLGETGSHFSVQRVPYDGRTVPDGHTWHWPERESEI